ncbi:MAG: hypothetical protein QMD09_10860 [Desulfatibacillaceae bacterium]|nr:hypothetical protein [Desulfatibacillaceae bacterium]
MDAQSLTLDIDFVVNRSRILPVSGSVGRKFTLGAVVDNRGKDPHLIMEKINMGGRLPRGAYLSQEPVAGIFFNALKDALLTAGFALEEKAPDLVLGASIEKLNYSVMMGFARCMLQGLMQVDLKLVNVKEQVQIWQGSFVAQAGAGTGDVVLEVFYALLDNILQKICSDKALQEALAANTP